MGTTEPSKIGPVVEVVPATTRANFAFVAPGGTGRFNLRVQGSDQAVIPSLSRYQAENAARTINAAFAALVDAGLITATLPCTSRPESEAGDG